VIAGHRRLAAAREINRQKLEAWEKAGRPSQRPDLMVAVPASIQRPPGSEYERQVAMWNAEETKEDWPESRKFDFFCRTYEVAPPPLQGNISDLAKELGMKPSTVRTYLQLRAVPELKKAMSDPSDTSRMPRAGRHKTLRAVARIVDELVDERPTVVRIITSLDPSGAQTKNVLAARLLSKYRDYAEDPRLGVGPGVALERTVPLVTAGTDVSDDELISWLGDHSVLRQVTIEQRATRRGESDDDSTTSLFGHVQKLPLRQRPGRLDEDELQAYVDDLTRAADYLVHEARKARTALANKLQR
jgi:hypothetical protein